MDITLAQRDAHTLLVAGDEVELRGPKSFRISSEAFCRRSEDAELIDLFSHEALVKAVGAVELARRGRRLDLRPVERRRSAQRVFSFGRGDLRCAWILGRKVRVAYEGGGSDATLEHVADHGIEAAAARAFGEEVSAAIQQAAQILVAYPCMCGTGPDTMGQHGALDCVVASQQPGIPIESMRFATVCSVCGRGWILHQEGDPQYSIYYDTSPWRGPVVLSDAEVEAILGAMERGATVTIGDAARKTVYRAAEGAFVADEVDGEHTASRPLSRAALLAVIGTESGEFAALLSAERA